MPETKKDAVVVGDDSGDKPYTTLNPMRMDREPTFRDDEVKGGVQRQPQVAPLASAFTDLTDRPLTDAEAAALKEKEQQS